MAFFKPDWLLTSIYALQPVDLKRHQINTILTDLDNTLIAWHEPQSSNQLRQWLDLMAQSHIQVIVVSNNNQRRVARAVADLQIPFIHSAKKPLPFGIKQALKKFDLNPQQTIMVGDQLLTDIQAGHLAGVRTVMVKPLVETDSRITHFSRFMEGIIMKQYYRKNPNLQWQEKMN
ncbi:YqeG family HAD IIIA-type phosphatase [Lapidilactobacillus wuchangensis]|uniref:YqeG family HAD IIIA-type phosphatase n=1 Tax=Lapidilactobacillus wuchangensis TaxID=2486001 RepID=UPI000F79F240|nr:YqeG family HAD IIIA-type phosphatase [Lapidilactobacillus wuchangensis]